MNEYIALWSILAAVFLVAEISTSRLVSIWFVIGALFALIASCFGANILFQVLIFVLSSALQLALLLPIVKKLLKNKKYATNSDRIIGETAIVTEDINSLTGEGQIKVSGSTWSAKAENGGNIPKNTTVTVLNISGVKAVVEERK